MKTLYIYLYKTLFCLFLVLLASALPSLSYANNCGTDQFVALQSQYFRILDYEIENVDSVMAFERGLTDMAECVLNKASSADDGLILIYAALLLKNNSQGAAHGYIPYNTLVKYKKYVAGSARQSQQLRAEIAVRSQKAVTFFKAALPLRPQDRRVPGWLAGAKVAAEFWQTGRLSDATFNAMMKEVENYPEFNLFTAMLALSDVPLTWQQEDELLVYALNMTDLAESPCSPFRSNADPVCDNSEKAPYNFQNSVNMMSDAYLRQAQRLSDKGGYRYWYSIQKLALQVKGPQVMNFLPNRIEDFLGWRKHDLVMDRLKAADAAMSRPADIKPFWEKSWRTRAYQCSSCHTPEKSLSQDVRAPRFRPF